MTNLVFFLSYKYMKWIGFLYKYLQIMNKVGNESSWVQQINFLFFIFIFIIFYDMHFFFKKPLLKKERENAIKIINYILDKLFILFLLLFF